MGQNEIPSQEEQILITASSKLIKHFRGLESSSLLGNEEAASLIGCVKKIVGISKSKIAIERLDQINVHLAT